ncbi:hypothetical protein FRB95_003608 [Tulasnella sp. JGI-2019a]|nr:hypothetical protein FRB95_003608 [Tulasnella sp. JGI-2019a]
MSSNTITVLITGSNQGLGYETALQLSKYAHVHLFISGRDAGRVKEALEKIEKDEGCKAKVQSVIIDVSNDDSIRAAVSEVEKHLAGEPLDVLVNNSGVALYGDDLRKTLLDTYAVNVFGTACTANAFLPLLKKSKQAGGGRILNISSGLGSITKMADPNGPYAGKYLIAYNSSKSALNAITVTLGMQHQDLHVVAIDPGYNATNMNGYSGPMDPKDGAKIMVEHSLSKKGKSPGYYSKDGELPW